MNEEDWFNPIGPFNSDKCTAAGAGVSVRGGYAGLPVSFVLTVNDSNGRKIPNWGRPIVVKVIPAAAVGGPDIDGAVSDHGDGTYTVTYVVPKRGNYMVNVECNGFPIMGSPFPVFFTGFSGPRLVPSPSEGVHVNGIEPVCPNFLHGQCFKTDCSLNHPTYQLLMTAFEETTMCQVPTAPSPTSMAAARAILNAQALQAHAAQSSNDSTGASEKDKAEMLKTTVQVSNLVPIVSADILRPIFGVRGTVVECTISESPEHVAYVEYSKPEQARAAVLALNGVELGGRLMKVEMAKSRTPEPASPHMYRSRRSMSPIRYRHRSPSLSLKVGNYRHHRSRSPALHRRYSSYDRRSYRDVSDRFRARNSYGSSDYQRSASRRQIGRTPSPRRRESYRDHSDSTKYRHPSSKHLSKSLDHHRGGKSSPRNDDGDTHRRLSNEKHKYKDKRRPRSKSVEVDRKAETRTHNRSRSASRRQIGRTLSPRRRESYRDPSDSTKYRHPSSKHLSKSPDHHRGGKSFPRNDDGDTHRRLSNEKHKYRDKRRPRSKSVEDDRKAETRTRNRSRSADRETNRRVSHAKHKSIDGRRSRSKSVEGGLKDETREEKHRRRSRNRSRSVSAETNSYSGGTSSRHRGVKKKSKHRRASRSNSPDGKDHRTGDGSAIMKLNFGSSMKHESDSENDGSPSLMPLLDGSDFDKSDICPERSN